MVCLDLRQGAPAMGTATGMAAGRILNNSSSFGKKGATVKISHMARFMPAVLVVALVAAQTNRPRARDLGLAPGCIRRGYSTPSPMSRACAWGTSRGPAACGRRAGADEFRRASDDGRRAGGTRIGKGGGGRRRRWLVHDRGGNRRAADRQGLESPGRASSVRACKDGFLLQQR